MIDRGGGGREEHRQKKKKQLENEEMANGKRKENGKTEDRKIT